MGDMMGVWTRQVSNKKVTYHYVPKSDLYPAPPLPAISTITEDEFLFRYEFEVEILGLAHMKRQTKMLTGWELIYREKDHESLDFGGGYDLLPSHIWKAVKLGDLLTTPSVNSHLRRYVEDFGWKVVQQYQQNTKG